jgi:hypothetical protein
VKRTGKAAKTKTKRCEHEEVTPYAAFVDDDAKEAFLLKVCEHCGKNFLLLGQYPLIIY